MKCSLSAMIDYFVDDAYFDEILYCNKNLSIIEDITFFTGISYLCTELFPSESLSLGSPSEFAPLKELFLVGLASSWFAPFKSISKGPLAESVTFDLKELSRWLDLSSSDCPDLEPPLAYDLRLGVFSVLLLYRPLISLFLGVTWSLSETRLCRDRRWESLLLDNRKGPLLSSLRWSREFLLLRNVDASSDELERIN